MRTLLAMLLLTARPEIPGGDPNTAIPFVLQATAEDLWSPGPPGHPGHFRVVYSGYLRGASQLTVAVHWQVRNPAGSAPAELSARDATLQVGLQSGIQGRTEPPAARLQPGQESSVVVTEYALPRDTDVNNLWWGYAPAPPAGPADANKRWWGLADAAPLLRVHLQPHPVDAKQLGTAHAPTLALQQPDADSSAPPVLSVMEGERLGPCTWRLLSADQEVLRVYTLQGGCPRVALHPQGKRALLTTGSSLAEIDLATGAVTPLPRPSPPPGYTLGAYDAQGGIAAVAYAIPPHSKEIASPLVWIRYSLRGKAWQEVGRESMDYPLCDAFTPERSALARDLLPQLVHVPGYAGPCNPAAASREDLNLPTMLPADPTWTPFPKNLEMPRKWTQITRAGQTVVANLMTPLNGRPRWDMPMLWARDGKLEPVADFDDAVGPLYFRWRGPYLLAGKINSAAGARPGTMEHTYRLFDVRTRSALATWHAPKLDVAFWPGPVQAAAPSAAPAVGGADTSRPATPKGWVASAPGTQQSFVSDVPFSQVELVSDRGYLDKCRLRCERNRRCLGFFEQTHLCPQPDANDHRSDPNKREGVGCYRICGFYDRGTSPLQGRLGAGPPGSVWVKETAFANPAQRDGFFQ